MSKEALNKRIQELENENRSLQSRINVLEIEIEDFDPEVYRQEGIKQANELNAKANAKEKALQQQFKKYGIEENEFIKGFIYTAIGDTELTDKGNFKDMVKISEGNEYMSLSLLVSDISRKLKKADIEETYNPKILRDKEGKAIDNSGMDFLSSQID